MDFLSIRKKARERAEARARAAREAAAPAAGGAAAALAEEPAAPPPEPPRDLPAAPSAAVEPPPAPAAAPAEPAPAAIEDELRAELSRMEDGQRAPPAPAPPALAPSRAQPLPFPAPPDAVPESPADPLDEFFWREDEAAPPVPDLGLGAREGPAPAAPEASLREYVAFLLGEEEFGVPIERVREILKPPPITEVPGAPAPVVGVISLRGEVVTLVDPRPRLALPAGAPGSRARLVVCDTPDGPVALAVDAVTEVLRFPAAAVEPRPPGIGGAGAEPIAGIGRDGARLVVLLDLDRLLPAAAPVAGGPR